MDIHELKRVQSEIQRAADSPIFQRTPSTVQDIHNAASADNVNAMTVGAMGAFGGLVSTVMLGFSFWMVLVFGVAAFFVAKTYLFNSVDDVTRHRSRFHNEFTETIRSLEGQTGVIHTLSWLGEVSDDLKTTEAMKFFSYSRDRCLANGRNLRIEESAVFHNFLKQLYWAINTKLSMLER